MKRNFFDVTFSVLFVLVAAAVLLGKSPDRLVLAGVVSSAEHEQIEGYYSIGDTTVIAKPGSDLYQFLFRHVGQPVKIELVVEGKSELAVLRRDGEQR